MREPEFHGRFRNVAFAILGDTRLPFVKVFLG